MGKTEIIAGLPALSPAELAEVQAKLDEVAGEAWCDGGELSESDKHDLEKTLAAYEASPDAGRSWDEVRARVQARLAR